MAQGGIDVRRADICLYLGPADRAKLEAIVADRNSPRKLCWRAEIVLGTADGLGTNVNMRRTGKSKPCVWRWQERYIDEGVPIRQDQSVQVSCCSRKCGVSNEKPPSRSPLSSTGIWIEDFEIPYCRQF